MEFLGGSITGQLGLDISPFTKGMFTAIEAAKVFPGVIGSFMANPLLGAADLVKEAFEGITKSFEMGIDGAKEYAATIREIAFADAEAAESAQALGLSVEVFTGLSAAAKLAGSDVMSLSEGLKFLNRNIADAAYGNQDLRREFMQLGISVVDATGHLRDTQDVFYETADAISRLPNAALRTRFAMDLMGRGAEGMLPFLAKGSQGMKDLQKESERFGATTSKEAAEAGEKFRHITNDVDLMWEGIKKRASEPVIKFVASNFDQLHGDLLSLSDMAGKAIANAFKWIGDHHTEIEADFILIKTKAMEAFNWIEGDHPKLKAALKEVEDDATAVASAIHKIGDAWVWSKNALEEYTKKIGEEVVHDAKSAITDQPGAAGFPMPKSDEHGWTLGRILRDARGGLDWLGTGGLEGSLFRWYTPRALGAMAFDASLIPGLGKLRSASEYMFKNAPQSVINSPSFSPPVPPLNVTLDPTKTAHAIGQAIKPVLQKIVDNASNAGNLQARQAAQRKGL